MRKVRLLLCVLLCGVILGGCGTPTPAPIVPLPLPSPSSTVVVTPTLEVTPAPPEPLWRSGWWDEAIFYEVFIRSFYDSTGDGIGDLQGLIAKLDYLNDGDPTTDTDLGVTALWLMPVMESPSYHGYDAVDYYAIARDYGSNEDFQVLIEEAHQRGIRVIIDLVINHTSSAHPWFINSSTGPNAEKRDWYVWSEAQPPGYTGSWGQQVWYERSGSWYYAVFWSEMPDLNYENPAVTEEMFHIARFWLEEMRADGFRLDAVRYLIETDLDTRRPVMASSAPSMAWLRDFREYYAGLSPDAMTVGEVWADTGEVARYINSGALDLAFEFNLATAILESVMRGSPASLNSMLERVLVAYPNGGYATFLTNHDQNRVMNQLLQNEERARLAAVTYLTLPGVPFIYYGEEIGMVGAKPDELIRTPMQWTAEEYAGFSRTRPWQPVNEDYLEVNVAAQQADLDSLWHLYRRLIGIRHAHPALRTGDFTTLNSNDRPVYAYLRQTDADRVLVVLNFAAQPRENVQLGLDVSGLPAGTHTLRDLLTGETWGTLEVDARGGLIIPWVAAVLEPRQTLILHLE